MDLPELRIRLDQMTERIVSRLKDRSRYPVNEAVYRPDGVPIAGRSGISLLDFSLEGLETYHASLGRFSYPDQYPLSGISLPESRVARSVGIPALPPLPIVIRDDLLAFYRKILPELCPPGDDPNTYGETAYVDADLLQLLNERINVGRYVAQVKMEQNPAIGREVRDDAGLAALLRDTSREAALLRAVRAVAARYQVDPDVVERIFAWIIEETMLVEIRYAQGVHR